jgi:hypothetical protein
MSSEPEIKLTWVEINIQQELKYLKLHFETRKKVHPHILNPHHHHHHHPHHHHLS